MDDDRKSASRELDLQLPQRCSVAGFPVAWAASGVGCGPLEVGAASGRDRASELETLGPLVVHFAVGPLVVNSWTASGLGR